MMQRLFLMVAAALASVTGGIMQVEAADPPGKVARVAFVSPSSASAFARSSAAFRDRLSELGWVEGQNLVLDQYWGEGHLERLPELMAQALARNPDVLVTASTPGALAAKKATSTVPIVVASMGDPVQTGVVSNLARPGGNLTALSTGYVDGFAGKWLELLLEAVPQATKVAVIWNLGNPVVRGQGIDLEKVAAVRGVRLRFIDVREPHEYTAGHVPGAKLIPVNKVYARREELPRDKELIFVCAVGQRSALACEMAAAAGLTRLYNLEGGTEAWIKSGMPAEK